MKTTVPILLLVFLVSCARTPRASVSKETTTPSEPVFEEFTTATSAPAVTPAPENSGLEVIVNSPQLEPDEPVPTIAAEDAPASVPPLTAPGTPPSAAVPGSTLPTDPGTRPENTLANPDEIVPAGMIDFRNMPLEQALTVYSEYVNRTLLRPAALPASQITLTTKTPLTRREIIQALDSVLGLNGIAMINVGDKFVKAVPQTQAVQEAAPPDGRAPGELPELGPIITHVVQLKYAKPEEVVPALQPFAKLNSILPIPSSGIIVLRDFTENVKRMLEMVERIDIMVPGEFVSEVIPIKYAKASEIADALNSLSGGGTSASIGGGGGGAAGGAGGTGSRTGGTRMGGLGGGLGGGMNRGGMGGMGYNQGGMGQQGGIGAAGGSGAAMGAGGGSFSDNLRRIVQRAATSGDLEILGKTKMIADERSNSLLIFATRPDMEMIKTIVAKLDVVLSQVLIETVILDVNLDRSLSYGVTAGQPPKTNSLGGIGGAYNNAGALGTLGNFFSSGLTNGAFPNSSGLTYFGRYKGELDVVVSAFAGTSRANVIQKPRILTSHARPGSIFVGRTVPYVTSAYYGGGFGGGPSSSYQQLRVGIGLQVTPFINPEGLVVMEIQQEIEEIQGSTPIEGVGDVPNTITRSITGEVAVNDGDTIILGGFIRNSSEKTESGVPLLKDIPLLGALFSSRSNNKLRNELLVLMRPTVLKTPEIAATASEQEKKRLPGIVNAEREFQDLENAELEKEEKRAAAHKKAQEMKKNKRTE